MQTITGTKYDCVVSQLNDRPTSLGNWDNIIALRTDSDNGTDYHFAKLSGSDWLHKPSNTAILKFNSAPIKSIEWSNERYAGRYLAPGVFYRSDIWYILYKRNHTYAWTGEHYHSGNRHFFEREYDCECGYAETVWESVECSGPPCAMIWSLRDTNSNE